MKSQFQIFSKLLLLVLVSHGALSQGTSFPFIESFDSLSPPLLPPGWTSSQNISPGANDFATSAITPRSAPHAVLSTNATIAQTLTSPRFDFLERSPAELSFYTRRSGTHTARVLIEASMDGGSTFPLQLGDSLVNSGTTNYVSTVLVLPETLAGRSAVHFRWRVVPAPSGATGTFRVDDIRLTVQSAHDLAFGGIRSNPPTPREDDSLTIISTIRNLGTRLAPSFEIRCYDDRNNDSIPDPNELAGTAIQTAELAPGDSVAVGVMIGCLRAGVRNVITQIIYPPDENPGNDMILRAVLISYRPLSLVINEILYAPSGTEPEWVEVYNGRDDTIDVRNWIVGDGTSRRTITASSVGIPPRGFLLLTGDSAGLVQTHPNVRGRIVDVSSFPTLNNSGDAVVLIDNARLPMDSLAYLPAWGGNSDGQSLERIDPVLPSIQQANWGSSRHPDRSTPGGKNSIARKDRDLELRRMTLSPTYPVRGDSVVAAFVVANPGFMAASSFLLALYEDTNGDSIRQPGEIVLAISILVPLEPLDSLVYALPPFFPGQNNMLIFGTVSYMDDEDTLNNIASSIARIGYPRGSVVINEIMYSPAGEPEWLELYNAWPESVHVEGWKVSNRMSNNRYQFATGGISLASGDHLVICKDTALLAQRHGDLRFPVLQVSALPTFLFNNSGDAAVLFDARELVMDSVRYSTGWGGSAGFSLERLDPYSPSNDSLNWAESTNPAGSTPGRDNSSATREYDVRILGGPPVRIHPGANAPLRVTLRNIGRMTAGNLSVEFFDDADRDSIAEPMELLARVHVPQSIGRRESVSVQYDWSAPTAGVHGIVAIAVFAPDERTTNNTAYLSVAAGYPRNAVVVNEIMYSPFSGEAEYVELMNTSVAAIDFTGWQVGDAQEEVTPPDGLALHSRGRIVQPGSFFVLASDSTILTRFRGLDTASGSVLQFVNQSGLGLSNDGDVVVVRDQSYAVVDSVPYSPAWHHVAVTDPSGRSLERIHPQLAGSEARSWSSCVVGIGGTPGRVNSIYTEALPPRASLSCSPSPFSPDGDGFEDFTVIRYDLPIPLARVRMKIFDVRGRLIRYLVNNEPSGSRRDIVWDGYDEEKQKARIGVYIIFLEGMDEVGGVLHAAKGVVVLAGKL